MNTEIARMYIKELKKLAESEGIIEDISVTEISKLPDVLTIQTNQDDETIKDELTEITRKSDSQFIRYENNRRRTDCRRFKSQNR